MTPPRKALTESGKQGKRDHGKCVGGPWDGQPVQPGGSRKGLFAWIDASGRRFDRPGKQRYLHRAQMWDYPAGHAVAWVYAESRWRECGNCGAFYGRAEGGSEDAGCQLCGED